MADDGEGGIRLDRVELAGSLGDLGTLLPLALGMIAICGMRATNVLMLAGGYYVLSGLYFRVPTAVQPMKVIAAYAIATGLTPQQISAAGLWMAVVLLALAATGLIDLVGRLIPKSVLRGIQLSVGVILLIKGVHLIVEPDPNLIDWRMGPLHTGLIVGLVGLLATFLLLDSKRLPAALVVVGIGVVAGVLLGDLPSDQPVTWGLELPRPLPYGWPTWSDVLWVLPTLVLPQLPTTLGNAIVSNVDLSHELYPQSRQRVTLRAVSLSMSLANLMSFALGGIPMCHGAGGLAAHHRFGARTAGANVFIGGALILLPLALGDSLLALLRLLPHAILGVLLAFAGLQLALMIQDLRERKDLFVVLSMLGLALAVNLATGFGVGLALAYALRWDRARI